MNKKSSYTNLNLLHKLISIVCILIIIFSCSSKETNLQSNEICECFERNESSFMNLEKIEKRKIVKNCFKDKIDEYANKKNDEHLQNSTRSKLLEFTFQITSNTTKQLNRNCSFFKENKEEIRMLLKEKKNEPIKRINDNKSYTGKINKIDNLENNSANIFVESKTGEIKKFFYKRIPVEYIERNVEIEFEEKTMESENVNWIKNMKLK